MLVIDVGAILYWGLILVLVIGAFTLVGWLTGSFLKGLTSPVPWQPRDLTPRYQPKRWETWVWRLTLSLVLGGVFGAIVGLGA